MKVKWLQYIWIVYISFYTWLCIERYVNMKEVHTEGNKVNESPPSRTVCKYHYKQCVHIAHCIESIVYVTRSENEMAIISICIYFR